MSTEKRNLKFISDPGHGWLSVPLQDLIDLKITEQISTYSYMTLTRAYLEEDCDATVYLNAAKAAGWEVTYKESDTNKTAIRTYSYYTADKLNLALALKENLATGGSTEIRLYNQTKKDWFTIAYVTGSRENKLFIDDEHNNHYQISKGLFLSRVKPVQKQLELETVATTSNKLKM
jgi:hypothetical protein